MSVRVMYLEAVHNGNIGSHHDLVKREYFFQLLALSGSDALGEDDLHKVSAGHFVADVH